MDDERDRLVGLAYRMLGTVADAEDAVQEAFVRWCRLHDQARADVTNPVGWFAKTTSRVCLDVLKSASRRHELYVGTSCSTSSGATSGRDQLTQIATRVRAGRLRTSIGTVRPLAEAVAALNPTERPTGKTIISLGKRTPERR